MNKEKIAEKKLIKNYCKRMEIPYMEEIKYTLGFKKYAIRYSWCKFISGVIKGMED